MLQYRIRIAVTLLAMCIYPVHLVGQSNTEAGRPNELRWHDDLDRARAAAAESNRLIIGVLSSSSVTAPVAEDRGRELVSQVIESSEDLKLLASAQCELCFQQCGMPGVLVGNENSGPTSVLVGVLDSDLRCQRLAIGLPSSQWLIKAINETLLDGIMFTGIGSSAERSELAAGRAVERLNPAWAAQVGNAAGDLGPENEHLDEAAWRKRAAFHLSNLNALLLSDVSQRLGLGSDQADLLRFQSLARHAETCRSMADAVLAIAPDAEWERLSRVIAETSWQSGYWLPVETQSPLIERINESLSAGRPVLLELQDEKVAQFTGGRLPWLSQQADADRDDKLDEAVQQFATERIELSDLASVVLAHDWETTDYLRPSPARYIVITTVDSPPAIIRWNEHELRVRRKLDRLYRTAKNAATP